MHATMQNDAGWFGQAGRQAGKPRTTWYYNDKLAWLFFIYSSWKLRQLTLGLINKPVSYDSKNIKLGVSISTLIFLILPIFITNVKNCLVHSFINSKLNWHYVHAKSKRLIVNISHENLAKYQSLIRCRPYKRPEPQ